MLVVGSDMGAEVARVDDGTHPELWILSVGTLKDRAELLRDADK